MCVDQTGIFVKRENTTRDAFLGGRLTLVQPLHGFRAGSDSVLLGASVPATAGSVLDLGAGVGAAGLTAAIWAEQARVLLAERDESALELARANVAGNGLGQRISVTCADVTASGPVREAAGLTPDSFDVVIANPPFFEKGRGTPAGEAGRDAARHADGTDLDKWVRAAASTAAPRGMAIFILPAERLDEALAAFGKRFGAIAVLPVAARPDAVAGRVLIRGVKGSRAPLTLLAPLVLHEAEGNHFAPAAAAVLRGEVRLSW